MRGVEGIGAGRAQTLFLGSRRATTNHVCVEAWVRHGQNLAGLAPLFLPQDCLERISNLAKQGSSVFKKRENPDRSLGIHGGCYTEMLLHSHSWRQIVAFPRGFSEICWLAYSTPLFNLPRSRTLLPSRRVRNLWALQSCHHQARRLCRAQGPSAPRLSRKVVYVRRSELLEERSQVTEHGITPILNKPWLRTY